MTLLTVQEAAAFLKFKNPNSLYNNKTIPRVRVGRRVRFVMEDLERWVRGERIESTETVPAEGRPAFRIRVNR
jgi:excisionase family DNA binding protein